MNLKLEDMPPQYTNLICNKEKDQHVRNEEKDQHNHYWDARKIQELNKLEKDHQLECVDIDMLYYFLMHKKYWILYLEWLISEFPNSQDDKEKKNRKQKYKQQLQLLHKHIQLQEWTKGNTKYANDKQLIKTQNNCNHFNIVTLDGHYNNYFCHTCKIYFDHTKKPKNQVYWNKILKDLPSLKTSQENQNEEA